VTRFAVVAHAARVLPELKEEIARAPRAQRQNETLPSFCSLAALADLN